MLLYKNAFQTQSESVLFSVLLCLHFEGINPTINVITDDIMIHGESDEQHDRHLLQVPNKCREIGLKLNLDRCELSQDSVQFYGNTVGHQGLQPDPKKVNIIIRMPAPTSKTELLSFLGMYNFLPPYIPKLSDVISTLCELSKAKTEFS